MSLDRATIAEAALELLQDGGVEGVSTRRLADRLGVKGPSLYWHFKNKEELFGLMSGLMFAEALPGADLENPAFDWVEWLAEGARGIRKVALSRRDGAVVMSRARPLGLPENRASAPMVQSLLRSGLSENEAQLAMLALGRFALGWVLYEQTAAPRATVHGGDDGFEFGLQTFLSGLKQRLAEA